MYDSIIIVGATATGKTSLSIKLAKELNANIINADSMYIYKDFNIGTAKPTKEEMSDVKHFLIDFVNPSCEYNVAIFRQNASDILAKLKSEHILPIVVGGTGFYIDSLIKNYSYGQSEKNFKIRNELENLLKNKGKEYLYNYLIKIDPDSANNIHINDTKRIIRAIEIKLTTDNAKSKIPNTCDVILKNPLIIGLYLDRKELYEKINNRVDIMINNGLIEEVTYFYNKGFTPENCNAMKAIGYKEIVSYIRNEMSLSETIDKIKQHSRNYAKRQITWFKKNPDIHWFNSNDKNILESILVLYNKNA